MQKTETHCGKPLPDSHHSVERVEILLPKCYVYHGNWGSPEHYFLPKLLNAFAFQATFRN